MYGLHVLSNAVIPQLVLIRSGMNEQKGGRVRIGLDKHILCLQDSHQCLWSYLWRVKKPMKGRADYRSNVICKELTTVGHAVDSHGREV